MTNYTILILIMDMTDEDTVFTKLHALSSIDSHVFQMCLEVDVTRRPLCPPRWPDTNVQMIFVESYQAVLIKQRYQICII